MYKLIHSKIEDWWASYDGPLFHSLLCDPPYHLTSIVKRFGKPGSAPAKFGTDGVFSRASRGFMGQTWDGGDIAFRSETWFELGKFLYPGAFGFAFGSSRLSHKLATAIEDAGFIVHPMIGWVYGSGFPKATNISKQIDKAAGVERKVIGRGKGHTNLKGDVYGEFPGEYPISVSANPASSEWDGYRYGLQALKPAMEPIIVFQKPYEGSPVANIAETGAGALNIDAGRLNIDPSVDDSRLGGKGTWKTDKAAQVVYEGGYAGVDNPSSPNGRYPANFILQHNPSCQFVGYKEVEGYTINRFKDGMKPFGHGAGHEFEGEEVPGGLVEVWECEDGCPVKHLQDQSGVTKSGLLLPNHKVTGHKPMGTFQERDSTGEFHPSYGDEGYADRFFFQANWRLDEVDPFLYFPKASTAERDAGLIDFPVMDEKSGRKNIHPSVKPISLIKYLASMLLPPDSYAPRRILVPFAGVGSEMIGCMLAGWDEITGIEMTEPYCEIAEGRLKFWSGYNVPGVDIKEIIKADHSDTLGQVSLFDIIEDSPDGK